MKLITSGTAHTDIDALACAIAYCELQNLKGNKSLAFLPGPLNATVPPDLFSKEDFSYEMELPSEWNSCVIVDMSDPAWLHPKIHPEKVLQVFDHHTGFEEYWQKKLGSNSVIRPIGAAATLIWLEWERSGLLDKMSVSTAKLLASAIVSNSLNFKAAITCEEDHRAYKDCRQRAALDDNWGKTYFKSCDLHILDGLMDALIKDSKMVMNGQGTINQLEMWDGRVLLRNSKAMEKVWGHLADLETKRPWAFLNLVSVSENTSYWLGTVPHKLSFEKTDYGSNVYKADSMLLRKEILRMLKMGGE